MQDRQILKQYRALVAAFFFLMVAGSCAYSQCQPDAWKGGNASITNEYVGFCFGTKFYGMDIREGPDLHEGGCADQCPQSRKLLARFGMWTVEGDPETELDNNIDIIRQSRPPYGPGFWSGFTSLSIDGSTSVIGDDGAGYFSSPFVYYGQYPDGPDDKVYLFYIWRSSTGNIEVECNLTLIRDQARFEYILRNRDSSPHNVGLAMFVDPVMGDPGIGLPCTDDQAYPYLPNFGFLPLIDTEFRGRSVPPILEMFDDKASPVLGVRFTLGEQDATPPDYLAIGSWARMHGNIWNYELQPKVRIGNHAVIIRWEPKVLAAGESKRIITYYGLAAATTNYEYPYALAVQGPRSLKFDSSLDGNLDPNPFTIKAYIYNQYPNVPLSGVNVFLNLPDGLVLEPGESARKTVGQISPLSEGPAVTWRVRATGTTGGELEYTVSASGAAMPARTVKRTISVPVTSGASTVQGWQLVSVPFNFLDPDPDIAFRKRLPGGTTVPLLPNEFQVFKWNPTTGVYTDFNALAPGSGFWLWMLDNTDLAFFNATPLSGNAAYELKISTGWNQIGNPFIYGTSWGKVKVLYQSQTVTVDQAASNGWIRRSLYWYDLGRREYDFSADQSLTLEPWRGYWLKSLVPCSLIFPPVETVDAEVSSLSVQSLGAKQSASIMSFSTPESDKSIKALANSYGWAIKLSAYSGNSSDSNNYIGISANASDAYDIHDTEEPPPFTDEVGLRIINPRCGGSAHLAKDIRSASGLPQVYDLQVNSRPGANVRIKWSNMESVPPSYSAILKDKTTGRQLDMFRNQEYVFRASGFKRSLQVVLTPPVLKLSNLKAQQIGASSVRFSFNLNNPATVKITILDRSGSPIRNLTEGLPVKKGENYFLWDCCDNNGAKVSSGKYTVQVMASSPDSLSQTASRSFNLRR